MNVDNMFDYWDLLSWRTESESESNPNDLIMDVWAVLIHV